MMTDKEIAAQIRAEERAYRAMLKRQARYAAGQAKRDAAWLKKHDAKKEK